MFRIQIDPKTPLASGNKSAEVKQVNGVNGSPISFMPGFPDLQDQFRQLGLIHIRMHDIYGVCDIEPYFDANRAANTNQLLPNVPQDQQDRARNFIADFNNARVIFPNAVKGMKKFSSSLAKKDANYAPTDYYLKQTIDNIDTAASSASGGEIMFRIGRSNDGGWELPSNFKIYAELVGELVKRYSSDLSKSGLPRKVKYWEIWNEPDLPFFWNTDDVSRYYEFYATVARKIRSIDADVKIGGAGAAFGLNIGGAFLDGLLAYCRANDVPLDFLSWHFYPSETADPQNILDAADGVAAALDAYGYSEVESICSEWNVSPYASYLMYSKVQSAQNAAFVASTLIGMNKCRVDHAHYYRGDGGAFGLFNDAFNPAIPNAKAFCSYVAQTFKLYNEMFDTPQLISTSDAGRTGISILAGSSSGKINILVANYRIDKSLPQMYTPPVGDIYYNQHYVDSGRSLAEITDDWSREHWFGGQDPTTLQNNNEVPQQAWVPTLPSSSPYPIRTRDYAQSAGGVHLVINDLAGRVDGIKAHRLYEGGDLSGVMPPDVSQELAYWYDGNDYIIEDGNAKESTVTLYTITLRDWHRFPTLPPVHKR